MHVLELQGPATITEGIEAIAQADGPDLVVIRGASDTVITEEVLAETTPDRNFVTDATSITNKLHEALELGGPTAKIAQLWQSVGYTGMSSSPTPTVDPILRRKDVSPHIDFLDYNSRLVHARIRVVVTGSLCLEGSRRVHAQRLELDCRRPSDGRFSREKHRKATDRYLSTSTQSPPSLRSSRVVQPGDFALWGENPFFTEHAVTEAEGATAIILDWFVQGKE